jgi:Tol biopolymer transport system component/Tfp pilus assembly protein PilX
MNPARTRLQRRCARLCDQEGTTLVVALGTMACLSIAVVTVMALSGNAARSASRSDADARSFAIAEAGIHTALSVMHQNWTTVASPGLLPQTTTPYDGASLTWGGVLDEANAIWTITSTGTVQNPAGPGAEPVRRTVTTKVWVSTTVFTSTQIPPDGTTDREIWVMNLDGQAAHPVTTNTWEDGDAFWSPDTGKFVYESEEAADAEPGAGFSSWSGETRANVNRDIWRMNADGSGKERLTTNPGTAGQAGTSVDEDPQWGPGGRIVFDSKRAGNFDVFMMDANGADQTNLTDASTGSFWKYVSGHPSAGQPSTDEEPAYGPDFMGAYSGRLVVQSNRDGDWELYTIPLNVDGSGNVTVFGLPAQITNNSNSPLDAARNQDREADWSPNGEFVAFMSNRQTGACTPAPPATCNPEGDMEIFTVRYDGSQVSQLTYNAVDDEHPGYTPDGRIVFNRRTGSSEFMYIMNPDGGGVTQISTFGGSENRFPDVRSRFVPYAWAG